MHQASSGITNLEEYTLKYRIKEGERIREREFKFKSSPESVRVMASTHAQNLSNGRGVSKIFELYYPGGQIVNISVPPSSIRN